MIAQVKGADDEQLGALYRGAAATIVPSRYEGFGLTLLEAMACGCPVASSGGGSLSEFDGEFAFRFRPHSPMDCASALVSAMDADPATREGAIEHSRAFTWEATAKRYRELYDQVSARRSSRRRGRSLSTRPH